MQFCGMVGVMSRIGLADFVDESMKMIGVDEWLALLNRCGLWSLFLASKDVSNH